MSHKIFRQKICEGCGKPYEKKSTARLSKWNKSKYCSNECRFVGRIGFQFSFEARQKMSDKAKIREYSETEKQRLRTLFLGLKHNDETKKRICQKSKGNKYALGNVLSLEVRKKMSESKTGHKHWNWKTDRSTVEINRRKIDSAYRNWRDVVRLKDGSMCRIGNSECAGRLEVHHILPWAEFPNLRYEIKNGITLCKFHHPIKKTEVIRLSPYFHELVAVRN